MSNELRIGIVFSYEKNGAKVKIAEHFEVDVAGDTFTDEIQSIGTSNVALAVGAAMGTQGWAFLKNLDGTNYIEVGITGSYSIKLLAGKSAVFPAAASLFAKADTAACLMRYTIIEL